jgi:hypothetical protein
LVDEDVHARFSQMWKKVNRLEYGDSSTEVLRCLMDFYEKHSTEEMRLALALIGKVQERAVAMPNEQWSTVDGLVELGAAKGRSEALNMIVYEWGRENEK